MFLSFYLPYFLLIEIMNLNFLGNFKWIIYGFSVVYLMYYIVRPFGIYILFNLQNSIDTFFDNLKQETIDSALEENNDK
jgi:hypothetical protein